MDKTVPSGEIRGELAPPVRKVTRSAPSRRRCWPRERPRCATSNCATTPARPCAASRRWAPTSRSPIRTRSASAAGWPRAAARSTWANRAFRPVCSRRSPPSRGVPLRIEGTGTLLGRPMEMMIAPLRQLGVAVTHRDGRLPVRRLRPAAQRHGRSRRLGLVAVSHGPAHGRCGRPRRIHARRAGTPSPPIHRHDDRGGPPLRRRDSPQRLHPVLHRGRPSATARPTTASRGDWERRSHTARGGRRGRRGDAVQRLRPLETGRHGRLHRAGARRRRADPRDGPHHRAPPSAARLRVRRHAMPRPLSAVGGAGGTCRARAASSARRASHTRRATAPRPCARSTPRSASRSTSRRPT